MAEIADDQSRWEMELVEAYSKACLRTDEFNSTPVSLWPNTRKFDWVLNAAAKRCWLFGEPDRVARMLRTHGREFLIEHIPDGATGCEAVFKAWEALCEDVIVQVNNMVYVFARMKEKPQSFLEMYSGSERELVMAYCRMVDIPVPTTEDEYYGTWDMAQATVIYEGLTRDEIIRAYEGECEELGFPAFATEDIWGVAINTYQWVKIGDRYWMFE